MSRDFNDGGNDDVLGSSEYFTGGCGCDGGGVKGGGYFVDNGSQSLKNIGNTLLEVTGLNHMGHGMSSIYTDGINVDAISYLCLGLVQMCIVILAVLLIFGIQDQNGPGSIVLYVVGGLAALGVIITEVMAYRKQ